MSRNNYQVLQPGFTINPKQTRVLDIDLYELANFQVLIEVTYALTSSASSGVTLNIYDGFGGADPTATGTIPMVLDGSSVPLYVSVGTPMTLNPVTTGAVSPQTVRTDINYSLDKVPRWTRLSFFNQDNTNACTIKIEADL